MAELELSQVAVMSWLRVGDPTCPGLAADEDDTTLATTATGMAASTMAANAFLFM